MGELVSYELSSRPINYPLSARVMVPPKDVVAFLRFSGDLRHKQIARVIDIHEAVARRQTEENRLISYPCLCYHLAFADGFSGRYWDTPLEPPPLINNGISLPPSPVFFYRHANGDHRDIFSGFGRTMGDLIRIHDEAVGNPKRLREDYRILFGEAISEQIRTAPEISATSTFELAA